MLQSPPANVRDTGLSPGLGDPLEKETSTQYSRLGKPMSGGMQWAVVHGGHKRIRHSLATKQQQLPAQMDRVRIWGVLCSGISTFKSLADNFARNK